MKTYFLLGGNDLEMVTIRNILNNNIPHDQIIDKNLKWGANLSDYKENLNDLDCFVGIELKSDINLPKHYLLIDHHNENSQKDSSLIQIIDFLNISMKINIPLTREFKLIAANDLEHIKGLLKIGATEKEIVEIRARDKKAQGVTKEMEIIALNDINKAIHLEGITIIKTSLNHFSPFTDALFPYGELIIYNKSEVNYYGEFVKALVNQKNILSKGLKPYFHPGKPGYWGISKIIVNKKYIDGIIRILINEMTHGTAI